MQSDGKLKHAVEEYLKHDPFDGGDRDVDVRLRSVRIVKTRKEQSCVCPILGRPHDIPHGTMARSESAKVEGSFCRYYVCIPCMDEWMDLRGWMGPGGEHDRTSCAGCRS